MQFLFSRGIDLGLIGRPELSVTDKPVGAAALLGADYPGLRPVLAVAEGERVAIGQVLFTDRTHPDIAFVAPMSGRIAVIERGPRRSLSALVIQRDETGDVGDETADAPIEVSTREALRSLLLSRGFWPAFRRRPFGGMPTPDSVPQAIFVTATDSEPLAPDPRVVLATQAKDFQRGVALLALLTDGPVYVCQSSGPNLAPETDRVRNAIFDGAHPAGLAGTHVHALYPATLQAGVWTIGCQDVAAIGRLVETGRYDPTRIIAMAGPLALQPRLLRTVSGASVRELAAGEHSGERPARVLSGSALSGRDSGWLGRFHRQVTMLDAVPELEQRRWLARFTARGAPRPIIPTGALESALPKGFLPVPLLRALAVGDVDAAARLGALDLIEEDVALISALCTSGADYGALLRRVLDSLEEAA